MIKQEKFLDIVKEALKILVFTIIIIIGIEVLDYSLFVYILFYISVIVVGALISCKIDEREYKKRLEKEHQELDREEGDLEKAFKQLSDSFKPLSEEFKKMGDSSDRLIQDKRRKYDDR